MPIAPTPIPPFPTPPPTADDPTNFPARGDATVEWFVDGVPGIDQAAQDTYDNAIEVFNAASSLAAAVLVAADAAGFVATSASTLTVGAGTKTITLSGAKPSLAVATYQVAIVLASDNSIKMLGTVATAPDSGHITVTVVTGGVSGSGTFSGPWLIIAGAFLGTGATAAEIWAGVTDAAAVSPKSLVEAQASQAFTEPGAAGTFTFNGDLGWSFHTTITGTGKTVGNPTNFKSGQSGRIRFSVVTGAGPLAFGMAWKFSFGVPVTASTNGLIFDISYYVNADGTIDAVYLPNMQS